MDVLRDALYGVLRKTIFNLDSYEQLFEKYPEYEQYRMYEKDFKAIKARQEVEPDFYFYRRLTLPEVFKWEDLFSSWRIIHESESYLFPGFYCSTTGAPKVADGWSNPSDPDKYYHLKVCLTDSAFSVCGESLSSLSLYEHHSGGYIVGTSVRYDGAGPVFDGAYLAKIYNLPEDIIIK